MLTPRGSSQGQLPSWFGLPFLLGGLLVLAVGGFLLLEELKFGREGAVTTGVVVEQVYSPGGGDDGPSYALRYEYADPATGALLGGSSDVSEETFDASSVGDAVAVTYLPAQPSKSRLGTTELQLFVPAMVLGGGAIFALVGIGLLIIVPRIRRTVRFEGNAQEFRDAQPEAFTAALLGGALAAQRPPMAEAEQGPTTEAELRALDARLALPPAGAPPLVAEAVPGDDRPPAD